MDILPKCTQGTTQPHCQQHQGRLHCRAQQRTHRFPLGYTVNITQPY